MSSRPAIPPRAVEFSMLSTRELVRRLVAAERALTWYANPKNWCDDDWGVRAVVAWPAYGHPGEKARRALVTVRAARRGDA